MANVFLDLGTHFGQGLSHFIRERNINDTWIVHTFEANPTTYEIFMRDHHKDFPWVNAHNKAVCATNGKIILHQETPPNEGATGQGSSIINLEYWNPWYGKLREHFQNDVEVESVSLSDFIMHNFSPEDNIIIKMDIEGSEFETLENLIDTGAIDYVNKLFVEWHCNFFTNKEEMESYKAGLIQTLAEKNVELHEWY